LSNNIKRRDIEEEEGKELAVGDYLQGCLLGLVAGIVFTVVSVFAGAMFISNLMDPEQEVQVETIEQHEPYRSPTHKEPEPHG